ncbi:uncharacterized protein [Palaemon carinicauda]|uniref:uncharacterized protein n=1 Tax=Palaemon carinicauda TaxID=392227 RepID=UPI0035B63240
MAQNKEFSNLELANPEDMVKPVFIQERGLPYRLSRSLEESVVPISVVSVENEQFMGDKFADAPGRTHILQYDVDVGKAQPIIKQCPYRLNPLKREIVRKEVKYMLDHNLVKPSYSPWSFPVVLVMKEDGQPRMCFDYHKVNSVTKTNSFPLPRVEDCIDRVPLYIYIFSVLPFSKESDPLLQTSPVQSKNNQFP